MEYTLKNGLEVEIRQVQVSDAAKAVEYVKIVNTETKNLSRDPDEFTMTVEEEKKFLENAVNSEDNFIYVAFDKDRLISMTGIHGSSLRRLKHKVNLGISVLQDYNNLGLGSILMDLLVEKAKELGKTKIELDVRQDNPNAIKVYKRAGFEIEGIRINGFYVDTEYIDLVLMGRII
ncbi:putative acetyltransferase YhhY [Candidatus Izimaplasma bacterium HR1]|jgi:RimJ/RimL family protein N-acetyltransferase|uniref:GNAT family N-acetyltransferase n=1 Tax=Candidatus Izimoplasma sp. HR1 TaxID=1541959 RepID=UPI0004F76777|nr:putative acetyltransferase YhhY [Candidatus Izimaplasma bacterium HR1]